MVEKKRSLREAMQEVARRMGIELSEKDVMPDLNQLKPSSKLLPVSAPILRSARKSPLEKLADDLLRKGRRRGTESRSPKCKSQD